MKVLAIIGWLVAVPFLALMWFSGAGIFGVGAGQDTRSFERQARVACAVRIEASLRNPASVEWDGRAAWPVIEDEDGLYIVIAKYRAENGFGGMVRETRQCLVSRGDKRATFLGIE